jgi:proteasome lid subunit RPN8/RPN11
MTDSMSTTNDVTTTMPVRLTDEVRAALLRHAEETYPHECCGALLGREVDGVRLIEQLAALPNSWDEDEFDKRRRFKIEPADMLAAMRQARRAGLDVLGVYHSHPDAPARPSATDLARAGFPGEAYLIAGVVQGRAETLTGWQLREDRSAFDALEVG